MIDKKTVALGSVAAVSASLSLAYFFNLPKQVEVEEVASNTAITGNWIATSSTDGKQKPPILIVEFGDYECPACRATAPLIAEAQKSFPDKIEFRFRQFVLPQHKIASNASPYAVIARDSGHFQEFHDLLMTGDRLTQDKVNAAKKQFNLADSEGIIGKAMTIVARDITDSGFLDINAIPTIFVVSKGKTFRIHNPKKLKSFIAEQLK